MKPQKAMNRAQLELVPEPLRQILVRLQMNDPATWMYLFQLAVARMGTFTITPQDLKLVNGEGAIGLAIDDDPPRIQFMSMVGDPQQILDKVEERRSKLGKETVGIDPYSVDEGPKQ